MDTAQLKKKYKEDIAPSLQKHSCPEENSY